MGTMIQRHPLTEEDFRPADLADHPHSLKGNNDLLSLARPDIIQAIHEQYFEAGADIVETNTFNSNRIAQADYHLEHRVHDLNVASAQLARAAADVWTQRTPEKPRYVAGSMGPTNRTASLSPDVNDPGYRAVTFDELVEAYTEQGNALVAGGADLFLVETVFDTLNAKAALFAIRAINQRLETPLPVMVSGTIVDASGRTLSGQTADAFRVSLSHADLFSIGLNCALGAAQLTPYLQSLSDGSDVLISAHPNAGLPNELGAYDQTPEQMADEMRAYMERRLVNIVGGCCGTTPEHIRAIAEMAQQFAPRNTQKPVAV